MAGTSRRRKFNLATQGKRQPGSSFKTFVLVTALDEGMPPSFRVDSSSPAYIKTKPKPWVVSNSEGRGRGMISLASATYSSVNTVFARVAWELGAKKVAKTAKKMGIVTPIPSYPSIALGTQNVSPYEMASAYGTLATGGIHHKPIVITSVKDSNGKTLYKFKKRGKRAISKSVAVAATNVLRGVVSGGTGRRAQIGRPAAGKTGTSQDYRDVWFVGYTPQLVTAVWVGYPKERTIIVNGARAFGGTVAAPIWAKYMKKALKGQPVLRFPTAKAPRYTPSKFQHPGEQASEGGRPDVEQGSRQTRRIQLHGRIRVLEQAKGHRHRPEGEGHQAGAGRVEGAKTHAETHATPPKPPPSVDPSGTTDPTP